MASTPATIAVTRDIPEAGLDLLRGAPEVGDLRVWPEETPPDPERLRELLSGCAGAITLVTDRVDDDTLSRLPDLRVVGNLAVGYDNIDLAAASRHGVVVCNTPDVLTAATADFTFALLMASARRVVEAAEYVRAGNWRTWGPKLLLGHDIAGRTLGIVGLGRIGREVARRAAGFDMKVIAYSPRVDRACARAHGVELVGLQTLLKRSDFVSINCALTSETAGMIGAHELATMKPTAILVNVARGPVVQTDALVDALRAGTIAGAALDVTDPEPLPADHPLVAMPNALVVPHIASATYTARNRMAELAAGNVLAVLRGERPAHAVNPEVLDRRPTAPA